MTDQARKITMFGASIKEPIEKLRGRFSSFKREEGGVAAIEFAIVIPFILTALLGSIALFDLHSGSRSIQNGTGAVVDLVTRQTEMDDEKRDLLIATAKSLMGKYSEVEGFEIVLTSVENVFDSDADPTPTVAWSQSNIASAVLEDDDLSDFDLPSIPEGASVVMVNVKLTYAPFIGGDIISAIDYESNLTRRPRFVDNIPYIEDDD